jgi:hypothetical protein
MNLRARIALALCAASLCPSVAFAGFIVQSGNNPQPDQENVLLNNGNVAMTIVGTTNNTGTQVAFTSTTQLLTDPSSGQARVEATLPPQVAVNDAITISLPTPGHHFRSIVFNANISGGLGVGGTLTLIVSGVDSSNNPESATFTLDDANNPLTVSNGSNFFTVLTDAGSLMSTLEIVTNTGTTYGDLRQIRIAVAPEPTALITAALSVVGLSLLRRRSFGCCAA